MNEGHDPVLTKVSHDQTSYSVPCRRPLCQCCRGRAYSRLRTVHTGAGELRRWADETRHHVTDRMLPEQLADGRIAFLKAELKITPPRETLWQQVAVAIHEGRVVRLVEMPTAGISDGQVTGLSGLIK